MIPLGQHTVIRQMLGRGRYRIRDWFTGRYQGILLVEQHTADHRAMCRWWGSTTRWVADANDLYLLGRAELIDTQGIA